MMRDWLAVIGLFAYLLVASPLIIALICIAYAVMILSALVVGAIPGFIVWRLLEFLL
jgi:hypothetical protein